LRWPAIVVLICIVAGILEFVLFRATAHTAAIFTVTQIAVGTSVVCTVAGFIGLRQKPKTVATVICGLGLVIGILGILVSVFALLIGNAFTSVSF
jgi:beta-lactamase regulating signal transducer with metallopeptidase domain